ncbi:MAG TPA: hypothetical protein VFQ68_33045 [Streptosporangiaceae bacterium]|nr:hypothetical protein [Streptosporangiaceae bacterium]
MAIVVLVLWLFTAGAGLSLLVSSNLGRSRPVPAPSPHLAAPAPVAPEAAVAPASAPAAATATAPSPAAGQASGVPSSPAPGPSKRELRRAARDRFDPPSLTAAKNAPIMPDRRSLLEFAHPALAAVGLGFWLGFTLVHDRVLGWIAFGLVTATVCLGLTWFTANARAAKAKAKRRDQGEPPPSFGLRLVVLHGGAATVTFALAALTALVLSR